MTSEFVELHFNTGPRTCTVITVTSRIKRTQTKSAYHFQFMLALYICRNWTLTAIAPYRLSAQKKYQYKCIINGDCEYYRELHEDPLNINRVVQKGLPQELFST